MKKSAPRTRFALLATLGCATLLGACANIGNGNGPASSGVISKDTAISAAPVNTITSALAALSEMVQQQTERVQAQDFAPIRPARALSSADIERVASSGKIPIQKAQILSDNDDAFASKMALLRSAKKEIRASYYIYSHDASSALFTRTLIERARAGVRVKLLLDFVTNYGNLDLFATMQRLGGPNMDIRFYNFPSANIVADAKYITLPCPQPPAGQRVAADFCQKHKNQLLKNQPLKDDSAQQAQNFYSSLFLAGLYGKNPAALKTALGLGAKLDPAAIVKNLGGSAADTNEAEKSDKTAQLIDFFKLYYSAKLKHNWADSVKLAIAMQMYGADLEPLLNEITGRLPLAGSGADAADQQTSQRGQDWDHITDYSHHKLLAVDGTAFQLGGRNIEDSYHMRFHVNPTEGAGKYIFMDTDFALHSQPGGSKAVEASFDRTFAHPMVADLATVQRIMPNDAVQNSPALVAASRTCQGLASAGKEQNLARCIQTQMPKQAGYQNLDTRSARIEKELSQRVKTYQSDYTERKKTVRLTDHYSASIPSLQAADAEKAEIYYIENTPFDTRKDKQSRRYGAFIGGEAQSHKNIHYLWYRGLENACKQSREQGTSKHVIFHTAYLLMPSGMLYHLGKMLNGDYGDCSGVHITLLTNSMQSTDLGIINVFARYQTAELMHYYRSRQQDEQTRLSSNTSGINKKTTLPQLSYYEYLPQAAGSGLSLHSKVTLLGDDIMVGSANADVRSYYMDSNNAVLVRNATHMNQAYIDYIENLKRNTRAVQELGPHYSEITASQLRQENDAILGALACRWDKTARNCPGAASATEQNKNMNAASTANTASNPPPSEAKASIIPLSTIDSDRISPAASQAALNSMDKMGASIALTARSLLRHREAFDAAQGDAEKIQKLESELNQIANQFDEIFKLL